MSTEWVGHFPIHYPWNYRKTHIREHSSFTLHSPTLITMLSSTESKKTMSHNVWTQWEVSQLTTVTWPNIHKPALLYPLQPSLTLNRDARYYHRIPGPLQQSHFSFHEPYLGHSIPCPASLKFWIQKNLPLFYSKQHRGHKHETLLWSSVATAKIDEFAFY